MSGGQGSVEEVIEFVVRANPEPDDLLAVSLADCAVLLVDPHGPHIIAARQFFEPQRRVTRVRGEQPVCAAGRLARRWVQRPRRAPKARSRGRNHSRAGSSGSSPSTVAARRNASNLGRGRSSASVRSQASSSSRRRCLTKRTKSRISFCLSRGRVAASSAMRWVSSVVVGMGNRGRG
jgi:hypothetical protein